MPRHPYSYENFQNIFANNILVSYFNDAIEKSNFPSILKNESIVFKKGDRNSKDIDQLTNSRLYLRYFRDAFFINYPILWITFCENTNVVFAKVPAHNIVY